MKEIERTYCPKCGSIIHPTYDYIGEYQSMPVYYACSSECELCGHVELISPHFWRAATNEIIPVK